METHCCPCSGLLWGLRYFCCIQHHLFPLLCWLNCFALKVGDPIGCLTLVIAYSCTTEATASQLQSSENLLKMNVVETKW